MPTFTTNFNYNLPLVNNPADENIWGGQLNANWTSTDSILKVARDFVSAAIDNTDSPFSVAEANRNQIILADATSGAITVNLIAAATAGSGFEIIIKKIDSSSNNVTIDGNGSETIDGATTLALTAQYDSAHLICDGSNWFVVKEPLQDVSNLALATSLRSYISGMIISQAADADHDITIGVGVARDSSNAKTINLSSAITKQIDNDWAEGNNAGGFPSGLTLAADTTYHVFVILNDDGTTVDGGYDTSLTATNLLADATDYSEYRRVGSVITDASSNIIDFVARDQGGAVRFEWVTPIEDRSRTSVGTTLAVTQAYSVPTGIQVFLILNVYSANPSSSGNSFVYFSPLDITDQAPSTTNPPYGTIGHQDGSNNTSMCGQVFVMTNTSSQTRRRNLASNAFLGLTTMGWIDYRR